jgi:large subunit ribosomal protein L14e
VIAMFEVGIVCMKIAGRDAGKTCVIVESEKDGFVLIEGETRRRKCNTRHLEPLGKSVEIKAGASHADVMKALGLPARESKPRKPAARPKPKPKVKAVPEKKGKKEAPKKAKEAKAEPKAE